MSARIVAGVLAGLVLPAVAAADVGAVVVVGKAQPHERSIVADAAIQSAKDAAWTLTDAAFSAKDVDTIMHCMSVDRPWSCIAPVVRERAIQRVVIIQVDPEKFKDGTQLAVLGQIAVAGDGVGFLESHYCGPKCNDALLIDSTNLVMEGLLKHQQVSGAAPKTTAITIHTVPPGANLTLDGKSAGVSDHTITTSSGPHTVAIELAGYQRESRDVTAVDGQTVNVDAQLRSIATPGTPDPPSHLVPAVLVGAGAATLIGCLWYQATLSPPNTFEQPERLYSTPAIIGAAAGGAAIGIGVYLWFRRPNPSATPTAAIGRDGGVIGWATTF